MYTIEVAAVNSAGTGVYSRAMIAETPDSKYTIQSWLVRTLASTNRFFLIFLKLKVCTSL